MENTLSIMLFSPLVFALIILCFKNEKLIKALSFASSIFVMIISINMFLDFNSDMEFNFVEKYKWIGVIGINYYIGVDWLSLLMVLLTNLTMIVSVLCSFNQIKEKQKLYYIMLLLSHFAMNGFFVSMDTALFYIFFEFSLIPMYFIIGIWGGENRKYATIKFFIYTMIASLLMLAGIIITYVNLKSNGINNFDISSFYLHKLTGNLKTFVFFSFLIAFAVKIPLFPFHTWLPDAHVQAPTAGSVILAGILLKMGAYGYIRFLIPMFRDLSIEISKYMCIIGLMGVVYASLMAWVQKDIKKLVAYSSIAHMGLIIMGIFSFNKLALTGSIIQMINHGISTGGLFLMIGILYTRTHTRLIEDYGGYFKIVPFISTFFMIIMLSSIAVPSTNGFIGEVLIFIGSFKTYPVIVAMSVCGVILGAVYMLSAYEKMFFGKVKTNYDITDINKIEWFYLTIIVFTIFWIGVYPDVLISKINIFTRYYLK